MLTQAQLARIEAQLKELHSEHIGALLAITDKLIARLEPNIMSMFGDIFEAVLQETSNVLSEFGVRLTAEIQASVGAKKIRLEVFDRDQVLDMCRPYLDTALYLSRLHIFKESVDRKLRGYGISFDPSKYRFDLISSRYKVDITNRTNAIMQQIENRLDRLLHTDTSSVAGHERFFREQSHHDAYVQIRTILKDARSSIAIVDPYLDSSIFVLLSTCLNSVINIRLLTSNPPRDFSLEAKKWGAQHSGVTLEVRATQTFHDRFLILDDSFCWHIGCSIKDAGKKSFMISEVEDTTNCHQLLHHFNASWSAGTVL